MILLTRGGKESHHHIKLNAGFREDVKMWQKFIDNWNGKNLFLNPLWETSNTLQLFTDAATTEGYWGIFQTSWFQGRWASGHQVGQGGINIDWQELFAIVAPRTIWATMVLKACSFSTVTTNQWWTQLIQNGPKALVL